MQNDCPPPLALAKLLLAVAKQIVAELVNLFRHLPLNGVGSGLVPPRHVDLQGIDHAVPLGDATRLVRQLGIALGGEHVHPWRRELQVQPESVIVE